MCWTFSQNSHLIENRFCACFCACLRFDSAAQRSQHCRGSPRFAAADSSAQLHSKEVLCGSSASCGQRRFSGHGSAFHVMGAPRILEIVIEVILILRCFIVPAELAAIVRELLQQFSEAGPCGGGALLCNIYERCCQGIPAS